MFVIMLLAFMYGIIALVVSITKIKGNRFYGILLATAVISLSVSVFLALPH